MATLTFNRYEKKYIVHKDQMNDLLQDLYPYINKDKHSSLPYYTICNIYYDTSHDEVIKKSVSKPIFKEKLRLRCYSQSQKDDLVFLELKKKFKGKVNKRRTIITLEEAFDLIHNKILPIAKDYHNRQVLNEIYFYVHEKTLIPRVSLSYDREAYFSKTESDVRITFDTNIKARRKDITLDRSFLDEYVIGEDYYIMEIKTSETMPLWLTDILKNHHIFGRSFSKYGTEFYTNLNREESKSCLNPYLISLAQV
jgi:SPX domain protein involved in polyphosphate accumulation